LTPAARFARATSRPLRGAVDLSDVVRYHGIVRERKKRKGETGWQSRNRKAEGRNADYQGKVAVYAIHDGTLLAGELPLNKHKLVVAWIEIHQEELLANWDLAVNGKKPFPIRGLDQ
jgi:hypothetical protein